MLKLYHHPFSAASRFIRFALGEHDARFEAVIERVWERRPAFLQMNPAAEVPVLVENDGPPVCGSGPVMEYLDETRGYALGERRLMPNHPDARAETRRLVEWFQRQLHGDATAYFAHEKIFKLEMPSARGGGAPDSAVLRAARANIRHHMRYIGYLAATRDWLAGDRPSFADLAAACELSVIDYLGEVPWDEDEHARSWYARVKSRPAFRPILADKVPALPPAASYADLDF